MEVVADATRTSLREDMESEATAGDVEGEGGKSVVAAKSACDACGALGRMLRSPTLWEGA
eukprot:15500-Eustigmatos_ZCMA.PRE.1